MPILTKLILNNKIVEFRKLVRQSRLHCIRKLSRDIKKLREKKGTEEQKTKNQKKAGRYVEEIFIMKKMKDDEISKFALLNEKTLNDITNDINESLEKKALARLVHHKAVAEKVQNFRETFPDWKNCLPLFLETLGEKYKHKKSTPRKESKSKKSRTLKIEDNSGTWLVEPITWKRSTVDEQSHPSIQESNDTSKPEKFKKRTEKSIEEHSIKRESVVKDTIDDNSDTDVKDTIDDNSDANETNENFSEEGSIEEESKVEGAVDPFFLTKDNAEYVSISAKNIVSNPQETKRAPYDEQEYGNNLRFRKREFKPYQYDKRESYDQRIKKREFQPNNFGKTEPSRNNRSFRRKEKMSDEPPPILHPSWEAKKKQNQFVHFEGKKVKFDDS